MSTMQILQIFDKIKIFNKKKKYVLQYTNNLFITHVFDTFRIKGIFGIFITHTDMQFTFRNCIGTIRLYLYLYYIFYSLYYENFYTANENRCYGDNEHKLFQYYNIQVLVYLCVDKIFFKFMIHVHMVRLDKYQQQYTCILCITI